MAYILTIAGQKGGAGKSVTANSYAADYQAQGNSVVLVDTDAQGSSAEWAAQREASGLDPIPCVVVPENEALVPHLEKLMDEYDFIVIDTRGANVDTTRQAIAIADTALLPFRPKPNDLLTIKTMANLVSELKEARPELHVFSFISQAPSGQESRISDAKRLLQKAGLRPLHTVIRYLVAWDDVTLEGKSVFEAPYAKKAAADMRSLITEIEERTA